MRSIDIRTIPHTVFTFVVSISSEERTSGMNSRAHHYIAIIIFVTGGHVSLEGSHVHALVTVGARGCRFLEDSLTETGMRDGSVLSASVRASLACNLCAAHITYGSLAALDTLQT